MKRTLKKGICIVIATMLLLSHSVSAFAENSDTAALVENQESGLFEAEAEYTVSAFAENSDTAALVENQESGLFEAEAEYTVGSETEDTFDDVTVRVDVVLDPEQEANIGEEATVTAEADTTSNSFENESDAMRNVYTVDPNLDSTADDIEIVAGGRVEINGATEETARTELEVSFDASRYDAETQDVVLKTYGDNDLDKREFLYISGDDIDTSEEERVTVRAVFEGIRNWILGLIGKNVDAELYVYRGSDAAKTDVVETRTENGNEVEIETENHYIWYNGDGLFGLNHSHVYNNTDHTIIVSDRVYNSDEHFNMAYYNDDTSFDIIGRLEGDWKQVTFAHAGYRTMVNVSTGSSDDLSIDVNPTVVGNSGQLIRAVYTVTNTGADPIVFSMGSHCDVQIGSDDYAPINPLIMDDQHIGFNMSSTQSCDITSNGNPATLAFVCLGDNSYITPVDSLWYGSYGSRTQHVFTGTIQNDSLSNTDSGMAYSWMNREIAPGETQTYAVLFGIGDIESITKEVEEIKNETAPEIPPEILPEKEAGWIGIGDEPVIKDLIEAEKDGQSSKVSENNFNSTIRVVSHVNGSQAVIKVVNEEGAMVDAEKLTFSSIDSFTKMGVKSANIEYRNRLTVKVDLESVKAIGLSDVVVVKYCSGEVSVMNGDRELMIIDSGALLCDTDGHVTVDFTVGRVVIFYDGIQVFELELNGAENGHYIVKLENECLKAFDDAGNLLAEASKN